MGDTGLLTGGLLSITFRQLTAKEIVDWVRESGLKTIEWGGDIHVPPGKPEIASDVAELTADAGLNVASYGSYYRLGSASEGEFNDVLESALLLGAPAIRVWAGSVGSEEADAGLRRRIVEDAGSIARQAALHDLTIDLEFHRRTLTDTVDSTLRLLEEIDEPNVRTYWQPPLNETVEQRAEGLKRLLPWVANIHTYHWMNVDRLPLAEGMEEWRTYLDIVRTAPKERAVMLEFVQNDDPQQFLRDAEVLKKLLA